MFCISDSIQFRGSIEKLKQYEELHCFEAKVSHVWPAEHVFAAILVHGLEAPTQMHRFFLRHCMVITYLKSFIRCNPADQDGQRLFL
jgi:hypothetical protein